VEPLKFPISTKMSVQVNEPACIFLRKEPTAPLDKRDWLSSTDVSAPTEICCGRPVSSQSSTDLCLPICVTCLSRTCVCVCVCVRACVRVRACAPDDYWSWW
jgi:hypothetical protein